MADFTSGLRWAKTPDLCTILLNLQYCIYIYQISSSLYFHWSRAGLLKGHLVVWSFITMSKWPSTQEYDCLLRPSDLSHRKNTFPDQTKLIMGHQYCIHAHHKKHGIIEPACVLHSRHRVLIFT